MSYETFERGLMYYAEKGEGAKMNGEAIYVSSRPLKDAYLACEINLDYKRNLDIYLSLQKKCVLFNTINAGFELSMVAAGKIDGRIILNGYGADYDFAPGAFLIAEAGGKVTNLGSDNYDFRNHSFVAANPIVREELRKLYGI